MSCLIWKTGSLLSESLQCSKVHVFIVALIVKEEKKTQPVSAPFIVKSTLLTSKKWKISDMPTKIDLMEELTLAGGFLFYVFIFFSKIHYSLFYCKRSKCQLCDQKLNFDKSWLLGFALTVLCKGWFSLENSLQRRHDPHPPLRLSPNPNTPHSFRIHTFFFLIYTVHTHTLFLSSSPPPSLSLSLSLSLLSLSLSLSQKYQCYFNNALTVVW